MQHRRFLCGLRRVLAIEKVGDFVEIKIQESSNSYRILDICGVRGLEHVTLAGAISRLDALLTRALRA